MITIFAAILVAIVGMIGMLALSRKIDRLKAEQKGIRKAWYDQYMQQAGMLATASAEIRRLAGENAALHKSMPTYARDPKTGRFVKALAN